MATYSVNSPYYNTPINSGYLDVWTARVIPAEGDDIYFTLDKTYENRPDLLSFDLYGTVDYWWVFAVRNPEVIRDPVFDFKSGLQIYLPKISNIKLGLGS